MNSPPGGKARHSKPLNVHHTYDQEHVPAVTKHERSSLYGVDWKQYREGEGGRGGGEQYLSA